jgi:SAM-dependent methyltransferase
MEFVTLAPDDELAHVSDALLTDLNEGVVTVLDIPCGTGSTAISLLATIGALRQSGALPLLPLDVIVVGGDFSPKALEIYQSILERLRPELKPLGVEITWHTEEWDATRADSTANLIDSWFDVSGGAGDYVVCISNFSGALTQSEAFESFSPSLEQILGRLHDKPGALIWIEPSSSKNTSKLLKKIVHFFSARISWFEPAKNQVSFTSSHYRLEDPIHHGVFDSHVEVQRFERR